MEHVPHLSKCTKKKTLQEPWWNVATRVFQDKALPEDLSDVNYFVEILEPRITTFMKMVGNAPE